MAKHYPVLYPTNYRNLQPWYIPHFQLELLRPSGEEMQRFTVLAPSEQFLTVVTNCAYMTYLAWKLIKIARLHDRNGKLCTEWVIVI